MLSAPGSGALRSVGVDREERVAHLDLAPFRHEEFHALPLDRDDRREQRGAAGADVGRLELHEGLPDLDSVSVPHPCRQAGPLQGDGVETEVEEDGTGGTLDRHAVPAGEELRDPTGAGGVRHQHLVIRCKGI